MISQDNQKQTTNSPRPQSASSGQANRSSGNASSEEKKPRFEAPSITMPKGGGAIQGLGEKFQANPVTGTGSLSVPIAKSPERGGFAPQLALSYDSGGGNSSYGLGWDIGLPNISRKTQKGLPQYDGLPKYEDAFASDVFILSGAEDLVPMVKPDGTPDIFTAGGYQVVRYRPRIEGLFARIEKWMDTISRIMMFHHFGDEIDIENCLVKATVLEHDENLIASLVKSVQHIGYRKEGAGYLEKSYPPVSFDYTRAKVDTTIYSIYAEDLPNAPEGIGNGYQFNDLYGEGLSGILKQNGTAWYYKRNLGGGSFGAKGLVASVLLTECQS